MTTFTSAVIVFAMLVGAAFVAPVSGTRQLQSKCDKCNVPVNSGGCKCNNQCDCIDVRPSVPQKCEKCNWPESQGGCKCNGNCDCVTPPQNPQPTVPTTAAIGIGWESGATYSYQFFEAKTYVEVYARTKTGVNGAEQAPTWADCSLAMNKLRGACGDGLINEWNCELRWGTCGQKRGVDANPDRCGWGSCIYASFKAPAVCATTLNFGGSVGASGASPTVGLTFGVGTTKLGDVVTGIFGQPSCSP